MTYRTAVLAEIDAFGYVTIPVRANAKKMVLKLPGDIPSPYVETDEDGDVNEHEIRLRWDMIDWDQKSFIASVGYSGYELCVIQGGIESSAPMGGRGKALRKPHLAILREMLKEPEQSTKGVRK